MFKQKNQYNVFEHVEKIETIYWRRLKQNYFFEFIESCVE